jgi:nicotinamide mononucleotide adenylyltransferase
MPQLSGNTQENLTSFIDGGLEMADDFLEDAVVHLQLRHFFLAAESLRDASQTVNIVERYLPDVTESDKLARYQTNVSTARERVHMLEQSITLEGTRIVLHEF